MTQLLFKQQFINDDGKMAYLLRDAVGSKITIKRDSSWKDSPFEEVKLVAPFQALGIDESAEYLDAPRVGEVNLNNYLGALREAVKSAWDPEKFNLVFRSSGIDGRLMSYFIREAWRERPGSILFVCIEPEGEVFKQLMEYEGWDRRLYYMYDIDNDAFDTSFSFHFSWQHMNVPFRHIRSRFQSCLHHLQCTYEIPLDLAKVNIWTGLNSNESWGESKGSLRDFIVERYRSKPAKLWGVIGKDTIQPFANMWVLRSIFSAQPTHHSARLDALRLLDRGLAEIPMSRRYKGRVIPDEVLVQMMLDYQASYYHRVLNPGYWPDVLSTVHTRKCKRWSYHWTLASLVEHLVNNGVEVV